MTSDATKTQPKTEVVDGIEVTDETAGDEPTTKQKKPARKKPTAKKTPPKKNAPAKKTSPKKTTAKSTSTKPAPAPKRKPAAKKADGETMLTLGQLVDTHAADLAGLGKSEKTIASYKADLRVAAKYFGEDARVVNLTQAMVAGYFESDAVCTNRQGKRRSEITINKVRRTFRMALERLAKVGLIDEAPIPPEYGPRAKKNDPTTKTES